VELRGERREDVASGGTIASTREGKATDSNDIGSEPG
jgi:hypothetical protein